MLAASYIIYCPRWITSCSPDCSHIKQLQSCRANVLICTSLLTVLTVWTNNECAPNPELTLMSVTVAFRMKILFMYRKRNGFITYSNFVHIF